MDPGALLEADGEIRARYKRINALVLVRHKQIVFERYYNGYSKSDVHHLASVTKSFLSALVGIAIDAGHIAGVDQKVLDFFPDYRPSRPDPAKTSLTIERLLTMSSGLPGPSRRGLEPLIERMHRSVDWLEFILGLPLANEAKFRYNSLDSHLLSALLSRATGMAAEEFTNTHLGAPIGMTPIADVVVHRKQVAQSRDEPKCPCWEKDPHGNNVGAAGLFLKPRDLARFGLLFLSNGMWNGRQVVSQDWVRASTRVHAGGGYGYQWWIEKEKEMYYAWGFGGQFVLVYPQLDLLAVILSDGRTHYRKNADPKELVQRWIAAALL
jgi:CubicO group peptidase (beta-lactamase class C family)